MFSVLALESEQTGFSQDGFYFPIPEHRGAVFACMHFLLHSQMGQPSRPEAQLNMTVVKSSPNPIISRGRSEYSDTEGGNWQTCSGGSLPTTPPPAGSSGSSLGQIGKEQGSSPSSLYRAPFSHLDCGNLSSLNIRTKKTCPQPESLIQHLSLFPGLLSAESYQSMLSHSLELQE